MRWGVASTRRRATLYSGPVSRHSDRRCRGRSVRGCQGEPTWCTATPEGPPAYCTRVSLQLEPADSSAHRVGAKRWSIQVVAFAFVSSLACSPPSARHPPVGCDSARARSGTPASWGPPRHNTEERSLCQSLPDFNRGIAAAGCKPNRHPSTLEAVLSERTHGNCSEDQECQLRLRDRQPHPRPPSETAPC